MYQKTGNIFEVKSSASEFIENLPQGIFNIAYSDAAGFYFKKIQESFTLPAKTFNSIRELNFFVESIKKSKKNYGIIFNGLKGSGKTFGIKTICNSLIQDEKLPVIVIENFKSLNSDLFKFLSGVKQNIVFFIDEFEKKFSDTDQQELLSFMDGVYNSAHKKIFLITTNKMSIDPNIIGRLGRVLYQKTFDEIEDYDFVKEFIKENTSINEPQIETIVNFLKNKTPITIDTLSSVCQEINNVCFEDFVAYGIENINLQQKQFAYKALYDTVIIAESGNEYSFETFKKYSSMTNQDKKSLSKNELKDFKEREESFCYSLLVFNSSVQNWKVGDTIIRGEEIKEIEFRNKFAFVYTENVREMRAYYYKIGVV